MGKEIICAGFGGQGVLTAGMLLINAGMEQDKNVLFLWFRDAWRYRKLYSKS